MPVNKAACCINIPRANAAGFTLVELVVGLIAMSAVLILLSTSLLPQNDRALDALYRVRSAELGQSVFNEIWGKRFDEQSNLNGAIPCNSVELGTPNCTLETDFGPDLGESRHDWDDIDDYHGMTIDSLMLASNQTYASVYVGYQLSVTVTSVNGGAQKQIAITVTTPNREAITFHALRSNF